ncbi:MAG: sulfotransferase domain-containing protein [Alteromonadaceae bacterium]|nr:sulfotransferase domain-containing protein [Alteromonadaceae bacterium]
MKNLLSQSMRNQLRPRFYKCRRDFTKYRMELGLAGRAPDFLLLGAQKAGTTSLFDVLTRHPLIQGSRTKELAFFDRYYELGFDWYKANFPNGTKLTGEATPDYLYLDQARSRITADLPKTTRFVVILRDPVKRLVSHYFHARRLGYEDLRLEEALNQESDRIGLHGDQLAGHPLEKRSFRHAYSYFDRGLYDVQLEKWFSVVPRDQFYVTTIDHFLKNSNIVANEVFNHLGLPDFDVGPNSSKNRGVYSSSVNHELLDNLRERYAPSVRRLEEMLGLSTGWIGKTANEDD